MITVHLRRRALGVLVATLTLTALASTASAQTKLLRFPAIHGDKIAFTYAGDIWIASAAGGTATRLTAHPGIEVFPTFSPDGKWIAFTGQYDGDEQVYVMAVTGGVPKQLTFYPARGPLAPRWGWDNHVYGWTPDGKSVLFRSMRNSWTLGKNHLFTVPMTGGPAEQLPMPESGAGEYSPDGSKIVYSPIFRDFRPEKRYGGGQANDLFIFDLKTHEAKQITDHTRADRDPMWIGNTIYFTSDRDGHFNIYAHDVASGNLRQITTHRPWDVRWPSSDRQGRIVYELNGELQVLDTKTGRSTPISITVLDDGLWKRASRVSAADNIEDYDLSPKGERALFTARGDVFTAGIESGPTRNLTQSSGAHDKWASWSPDGSKIAFISDRSGEEELWLVNQDGSGAPEQVTRGGRAMRYAPVWAPDGKRIAFGDKDGKVYVVSLDGRKLTEVADAPVGQVRDYVWSPRGNYLAFTINQPTGYGVIHVWSAKDGQTRAVTERMFDAGNPAWDPDGNYLFYLSNREFAPQISNIEFNFALNRSTQIYAMALRKDVPHPFPPKSDEVTVASDDAGEKKPEAAKPEEKEDAGDGKKEAGDEAKKKDDTSDLTVDFDGLSQRVARVPLDADNYGGLSAKKGHLLYIVGPAFYYGRGGDRQPSIRIYAIKDRKETTLVENSGSYALSGDGGKLLARQGPNFAMYDADPRGGNSRKAVSTSGLMVDRVPTEEWKQIFDEVWRRYRDWFYVENMHGYDWAAIKKQYEPWLAHVAHRSDLNHVISEMVSELTVQHAYVDGGDYERPERPQVALPGARFELDKAAGRFKIAEIFPGHNEESIYRSPLTEIGVNVSEGDYVLAIDGEELKPADDPYRLLRHKADRPVELTVNSKPTMEGSRTVSFNPVTSETQLIYLDWILGNMARVDKLSNGRLGYIHIPDMGANGIREFIKWYYPQLRKEGLVVDVRANGGGNVSRMLIERLRRDVLALNYSRTADVASTYPDGVMPGPMVSILDANSASDGDIFPAMFKEAGLGPLVGKRSWGGVVGISGRGPLIDGGSISVPESGFASAEGKWIIEGYGVDPDIEVDQDPKAVIEGRDPQLERAVAELMKQINATPTKLPGKPAGPIKTETPKTTTSGG